MPDYTLSPPQPRSRQLRIGSASVGEENVTVIRSDRTKRSTLKKIIMSSCPIRIMSVVTAFIASIGKTSISMRQQ